MTKRTSYVLAAVAAVLLAACGNDATRVHLDVATDGSSIDYYEVRVGDHTALANPLPTLDLLVPDHMGGQSMTIQVWGLQAGKQIAYGTTMLTPKKHGSVSGSLTLAAVVCGEWCQEGTVACDHDGTTMCVLQEDGCMGWSEVTPCPSDTPFCSNGTCELACSDECVAGTTECDTSVGTRTCGEFDSDSCTDWGPVVACGHGQTCMDGTCTGTTTCDDGDSCNDGDSCTINDSCTTSVCSGDPKCTTAPTHGHATCTAGTCGFDCDSGYTKVGTQCVARAAIIFVSSTHYKGNLGGLSGADAKCQAAADAAVPKLTGTFKAYLADSVTSVDARFVQSTRPYELVDGTRVADDYTELTSGLHKAPVDLDENGASPPDNTYVWTGQTFGGLSTSSCNGSWMSSSASFFGVMISTADVDWTKTHLLDCGLTTNTQFPEDGRLFCVEQLP